MGQDPDADAPEYQPHQSWKFDNELAEFKNKCQILSIDDVDIFRVAVEFSSKGGVYDHYAAIVTVDRAGLDRSVLRLTSKKSRLPRWLASDNFSSIGCVVFVEQAAPSINAGLLLALDSLLTLETAIHVGRLDRVETLIEDDPGLLNRPMDLDDETPLMLAARADQSLIAENLIERGATLDVTDSRGRTSVHLAVEDQCHRVLKVLLRHGASVNTLDNYGTSPLHWAASTIDERMVRVLRKNGADVDLRSAVYINGPEFVIQQIHDHPEVVATAHSKNDLLCDAIRVESVALVKVLLELGADSNDPGRSGQLLLLEQAKWNPEMVEMLLRFGADPNAVGYEGQPLIVSIAKHDSTHPSIPKLIEGGATVDLVTELYVHGAEWLSRKLKSSKQTIGKEDAGTLLYHSIRDRCPDLVQTMLDIGADPDQLLTDGYSALRTAVTANPKGHSTTTIEQYKIVEMLLMRGADPNPKDHPHGLSLLAHAKGKWRSGKGTAASSWRLIDANGQKIVQLLESRGAKSDDFHQEDEAIISRMRKRSAQ